MERQGTRVQPNWCCATWIIQHAYLYHTDYYSHLLLDVAAGRQIAGVSNEDIVAAGASLQADLDAAVRHARDNARRLNAEYDQSLVMGDWRGLSALQIGF